MAPINPSTPIHSEVAASGRMVAVARVAVYSENLDQALYRDPLLEDMRAQLWPNMRVTETDLGSPPMYFHLRAHRGNTAVQAVATKLKGHGFNQLQLVAVGAGWDTRPWLQVLGLQQLNTTWFSVDVPEVLEVLQSDLQAVGAQTAAAPAADDIPTTCKHPLQVSRFVPVTCDLRLQPDSPDGFMSVLCKHGFDATVPTVWLCEGILYYLPGECVTPLLQAMSSNCGPHSLLVADMMNDPLISALKKSQLRQYDTRRALVQHFMWGCPDKGGQGPTNYLREQGWLAQTYPSVIELARQHNRNSGVKLEVAAQALMGGWRTYFVIADLANRKDQQGSQ